MNLYNVRLIRPNVYGRKNKEAKAIMAVNWLNILRVTDKVVFPNDSDSKQLQTWTAFTRNIYLGTITENRVKVKKKDKLVFINVGQL